MSIPFTGILGGNSGGITSAIAKQVKSISLKPVKRIQIKFDPFTKEATEIRSFLFNISNPKVRETNPSCIVKTEVLCNRSDPSVYFKLNQESRSQMPVDPMVLEPHIYIANGGTILFKSKNLTALEMLKLMNTHITVLAPKEVPTATVSTKAQKRK